MRFGKSPHPALGNIPTLGQVSFFFESCKGRGQAIPIFLEDFVRSKLNNLSEVYNKSQASN